MHKACRAIIMAAGMGKRLQPITKKTPKPLIKVNGVRMIDTVIRGLQYNGIKEIYVVVGYMKEQFKELGVNEMNTCKYYKVDDISELTEKQAQYVINSKKRAMGL